MKTTEAVRFVLEMSEAVVMSGIDEMADAPLTQPTPRGGCHPLWVLGHVTLVEGSIRQILFDEPNPVACWADVFGAGTEAVEDAGQYPPFEVVRARFTALRSETMSLLESLSDEDLSKPTTETF